MELTPAQWLALVAEKAAELRKAGVRKLVLPQLQLELDAYEPEQPAVPARDPSTVEMTEDSDPLNDPTTFAMRDGSIPGFKNNRRGDE